MPSRKASKSKSSKSKKSRNSKRYSRKTMKSKGNKRSSKRNNRSNKVNKKGGAVRLPTEYFGGNSGRYSANPPASYDTAYGPSAGVSMGTVRGNKVGPNLGPGPNSNAMTGGAVRLPSEYFGGNSGRYSPNPSASYDTAYGPSVGVSMGSVRGNVVGPNLGPGPNSSSSMTGGGLFSSSKKSKRAEYIQRIKNNNKKIKTYRKNSRKNIASLRSTLDLSNNDGVKKALNAVSKITSDLQNISKLRQENVNLKQYV